MSDLYRHFLRVGGEVFEVKLWEISWLAKALSGYVEHVRESAVEGMEPGGPSKELSGTTFGVYGEMSPWLRDAIIEHRRTDEST